MTGSESWSSPSVFNSNSFFFHDVKKNNQSLGSDFNHLLISIKSDSQAAKRVLEATPGIPKPTFLNLEAGFEHFTRTGISLPPDTVNALRTDCTAALFGAVSSPSHKVEGYSSPIVKLRKELDLYANIRPIHSNARQLEITVVRENTECLYIKQETLNQQPEAFGGGKIALAVRQITQRASERIGRMAGEVALRGAEIRSQLPEDERIWKVSL